MATIAPCAKGAKYGDGKKLIKHRKSIKSSGMVYTDIVHQSPHTQHIYHDKHLLSSSTPLSQYQIHTHPSTVVNSQTHNAENRLDRTSSNGISTNTSHHPTFKQAGTPRTRYKSAPPHG